MKYTNKKYNTSNILYTYSVIKNPLLIIFTVYDSKNLYIKFYVIIISKIYLSIHQQIKNYLFKMLVFIKHFIKELLNQLIISFIIQYLFSIDWLSLIQAFLNIF